MRRGVPTLGLVGFSSSCVASVSGLTREVLLRGLVVAAIGLGLWGSGVSISGSGFPN